MIYLGNLLKGDLGMSFTYRQPVMDVVLSVFPNTIVLTLVSLIAAYLFGTVLGVFMAWFRGRWFEKLAIPVVLTTRAAPEFWLGMILLALFAFGLGWFPSGGANSAGLRFDNEWQRFFSADFLKHLVLPALTLGIYLQGMPAMLMRSSMVDVMK